MLQQEEAQMGALTQLRELQVAGLYILSRGVAQQLEVVQRLGKALPHCLVKLE